MGNTRFGNFLHFIFSAIDIITFGKILHFWGCPGEDNFCQHIDINGKTAVTYYRTNK